jgi:hypothetical protein
VDTDHFSAMQPLIAPVATWDWNQLQGKQFRLNVKNYKKFADKCDRWMAFWFDDWLHADLMKAMKGGKGRIQRPVE